MKTATKQIQELLIITQHGNEKYRNQLSATYIRQLTFLLKEIRDIIRLEYDQEVTTKSAQASLQKKINKKLKKELDKIKKGIDADLREFMLVNNKLYTDQLTAVFEPVQGFLKIKKTKDSDILSGYNKDPMTFEKSGNHTVSSLWGTFTASLNNIVKQTVDQAYTLDESLRDFESDIYGIAANTNVSKGNLDAFIGTLVAHGFASVLQYSNKNNLGVFIGYSWDSVMDSSTTEICTDLNMRYYLYDAPEKSTLPYEIYPPAHYRCFDSTTEVMTKNGWKLFKNLSEEDTCLSINPDNIRESEYIKPIKHISYFHEGEMLHLNNRGFSMCVTKDHQIPLVHMRKNKEEMYFVDAQDLPNWDRAFFRGLYWEGDHSIKIARLGDYEIPIELYCTFMGYFLSEGSSTEITKDKSYRVKIAQEKYHDKFYNDLKDLPFNVTSTGRDAINIYDRSVGKDLQQYGKSYQKYVPEVIKQLPPDLIKVFLDAYILGDGTVQKGKPFKGGNFQDTKIISTSSVRILSDLSELGLKIGKRPSIALDKPKGTTSTFRNGVYTSNHDTFKIFFCHKLLASVDRVKRDVIDYADYVYCVELPKWHTLLVKHNGKVAWSGNCRSSVSAITKTYTELGIDPNNLTEQQKELLGKPDLSQFSYTQFVESQPVVVQKELLGAVRYDMWRKGEIEISQFYTRDGRKYSLYELQKKNYEVSAEYLHYIRK